MVKKKQQTEKKEPGIYKRILKWIGLFAISFLIILALIFQAPWKVIALLLIVLAACTVLPKPYRKWFWLSVAAIVLVLIIWVFLPEDTEGWRPYTFDEELAAIEAKRAIPDSENAATIYNQLLEDYDNDTESEPNFLADGCHDPTYEMPWLSKDYPEIAQWLKRQQITIATLIEASKIENCRFPIVANTVDLSKQTDRLSPMRRWTLLLIRAGNNDMAEGRVGAGLEKYLCVRKMGDHMRQQSTMIEMMVGMVIEALALGQFKTFVVTGDPAEEHLSIIKEAVADIKHDWAYDLPRILEFEKLMTKNMLCSMLYEVNPQGKTRFTRDPKAAITAQFAKDMSPTTYWQRKLTNVGTVFGWFFMSPTPQKAAEIIDASYERLYTMADPDFDWKKEPEKAAPRHRFNYRFATEMLVYILEPAYYRIHDLYLRAGAQQRDTRLIITLRRYKNENSRWPESLEDIKSLAPAEILVDPINGDSFVYKLTEENFTLYSKGKNNIDEGGQCDPESGADDRLIWPRRSGSCKTKEEKVNDEQQ